MGSGDNPFKGMNQDIIDFANNINENPVSKALAQVAETPGAGILPGVSYVSLPERLSILRESPFYQQALNMPGRGATDINQIMGEMNQGRSFAYTLKSLANALGIDQNRLGLLLGTHAGR